LGETARVRIVTLLLLLLLRGMVARGWGLGCGLICPRRVGPRRHAPGHTHCFGGRLGGFWLEDLVGGTITLIHTSLLLRWLIDLRQLLCTRAWGHPP
jgi:hypothetical protein